MSDVNHFTPRFLKEEYTITLPLPLPKNLDITLLDNIPDIIAEDKDIKNNFINFWTNDENNYFTFKTTQLSNGKTFKAHLITAKQITKFKDKFSFSLYANDSAPDQKFSKVNVNILQDNDEVFESIPKFENTIYETKLNEDMTITSPVKVAIEISTYTPQTKFERLQECMNYLNYCLK